MCEEAIALFDRNAVRICSVTCTFLRNHFVSVRFYKASLVRGCLRAASSPDIASSLLLQEWPDLLQLAPPCTRIVQQVAQFCAVRLRIGRVVFRQLGIALQDKYLMLRPAFLPNGVH